MGWMLSLPRLACCRCGSAWRREGRRSWRSRCRRCRPPGRNDLKLFCPDFRNKLECLSLASIYSQV